MTSDLLHARWYKAPMAKSLMQNAPYGAHLVEQPKPP
jgi:hypothetical protein